MRVSHLANGAVIEDSGPGGMTAVSCPIPLQTLLQPAALVSSSATASPSGCQQVFNCLSPFGLL